MRTIKPAQDRNQLANFAEAAAQACKRLLGDDVASVESPGGSSRRSLRVYLAKQPVIVTRRRHSERARLEAAVLRVLAERGAPIPRLLAHDGEWLIQEDLGTQRLSRALAGAGEAEGGRWLASAINALAAIQAAGRAVGLSETVVAIGHRTDWLARLAAMPDTIGHQVGIPAPVLPVDKVVEHLRPIRAAFIKWDARPGNAVARPDGSVAWFDWEHCGVRHPLDDLAWLLCDEHTPDWPDMEAQVIDPYLPVFVGDASIEAAPDYLMTFGTFHSCVRLALILKNKADGPWWNAERCLDEDSVGVTLEAAQRVCRRAARWAAQCPLTEPLSDWFMNVARRLESEPPNGPSSPDRGAPLASTSPLP